MPKDHRESDSAQPTLPAGESSRGQALIEVFLIFLVFALHAGWPAPDVNEAHYLCKARHFYNPDFGDGDFFLESADAHAVFYRSCGWLSQWVSLPAMAWIGRIVTWWLLAWSFRRLAVSIVPERWLSIAAAALFVALSEGCHMAGEWVIGGFEAKGFAYVLMFLALEALVRDRWTRALCLLGAASSFHVLVGGWTVVAIGMMWLFIGRGRRPPLRDVLLGLAGGLLLALPGLIPALSLDWHADRQIVNEANEIYVFQRLRHHLVPAGFEADQTLKHLALIVVWLVLCALTPYGPGARRFRLVVLSSLLIGLAAMVFAAATTGDKELAARLLRFYWFRLGDALLPLGVAIIGMAHLVFARRWMPGVGGFWLGVAVAIGGYHLSGYAVRRVLPDVPRGDRPGKLANYPQWLDVCRWIADPQNVPHNARFLTPRMAQTFKWHTGHPEVGTWKDLPQDAESVVEWWRRMKLLHWSSPDPTAADGRWLSTLAERSPDELRALGEQFDAPYLLTEARTPLELPLLYSNDVYAVYDLR